MSVFNWFKNKKFTPTHMYLTSPIEILDQWYIDSDGLLFVKFKSNSGYTGWAEDIFLYEINYCGK